MKPKRLLKQLILAGCGSLLVTSSFAQMQDPGFWYGGLSVGKARHKVDESAVSASALGGAAVTGINSDERDTAYKLFGGYQFNRNIGLEAGFFDLGDTSFTATAPGGALTQSSSVKGFNIDLVGTLPITERFSLLGRVGAAYGRNRTSFGGPGSAGIADLNPTQKKTYPKVGLGVQYEINRSFWVRGEVERYRVSNAVNGRHYVDTVTLGLVFPFGRAPERVAMAPTPAPYVAPPPAMVQAAPPPPPPPAPPPPPPAPTRVSLKASSLFGFDRAELQPAGKAELDKLANDLRGMSYQTVVVEGHTDRLGSTAYNQKLSLERAAAVRSYLVSSGGVGSEKISAVGKGETEPVTTDCKGTKATAALVACLQPDRRVVVIVDGTR